LESASEGVRITAILSVVIYPLISLKIFHKIKNGDKKWLLKQITHKYLPKEMMDRPKKGFGVPIQEWFKEELKEYFEKYLSKKALNKHELFDVEEVIRMKDEYLCGANIKVTKLWYILMFQM